MANGRLKERNSAISEMLSDGKQLKNFYRFIAQNPHINLHDACQIVIERPNATVCYSFNEWSAMDRRITKGRKGIAYYDSDGYKQFVFDANDTHGDNRYSRPVMPMSRLLVGMDKLNDTEFAEEDINDYLKIYKGVESYLQNQNELTGEKERDSLIIEGIAYSLYSRTGFPKITNIKLNGLPYDYSENAELVKEIYVRTDILAQDIDDAYINKRAEVRVIEDTDEETVSDEIIVSVGQAEQISDEPKHPLYTMYEQYNKAQNANLSAVVLMRFGDFYEAFDNSAKTLSRELDLTLTGRDFGLSERVPMCGIPFHAMDRYLEKILQNHNAIILEPDKEPKIIQSYMNSLEQSETVKEKQIPILEEIDNNEPTPFESGQTEMEDWRSELVAEIDDLSDGQLEKVEIGNDEETDYDETDSRSDGQNELTEQKSEQPKNKFKSTSKKSEQGIKDRKRKEKPQVTLFELFEPQEKSRLEQLIEQELKYGSGVQDGKFRIFDKYNENPSINDFIGFLKKEYGWGGHSGYGNSCQDHSEKGIKIYLLGEKGEMLEQTFLKWPEAAERIADLIDDDNYFTESEKEKYVEYRIEENRQKELRAEELRRKNELIDKFISSANQERKQRILDEYANTTKLVTFSEFLKNEYGNNEFRGEGYSVIHDVEGVWLYRGENHDYQNRIHLNWNEFADKVCNLIENDRYIELNQTQETVDLPRDLDIETDEKWDTHIDERVLTTVEPIQKTKKPEFNRFKELTAEGKAFFDSYQRKLTPEPINSIWGKVESCRTVANGIYEVTTDKHGGMMIATELAPYVFSAEALEKGVKEKEYLCYEEDCEAAIPLRELYDKGILTQQNNYFTHYYVQSKRPEAQEGKIKGSVPFKMATEEEKAGFFEWWNNAINGSLVDWNNNYWQAHEQAETHEEKDYGENTDLTSVLDQSELGGAKARFKGNVAAIRLVNKLYSENRNATETEKKILSQFVGWGGLSQAFDENNEQWKKEYSELKSLLSQEDYEQARSSTLNAYYTPKILISSIYAALNHFGVKGNNLILEPSMGTGNFFGFMPKDISAGSKLYGVELDNLTGRIAAKLYPQANVQIKGFEDTSFPDNKFDIVVGNVPFGGYGVADSAYNKYNFKVHDYFLAKSIDKVKPNGIVAIVTSKGTMDKQNSSARKYIAERAELLGAIRLPNTAFKQTAGTEAVADILFFRKREEKLTDLSNEEWIKTDKTSDGFEINEYFVNHHQMILGTLTEEVGLYGCKDITVKPDGRDILKVMAEAIFQLPKAFYNVPESPITDEFAIEVDYSVKPMCYKAENGRLYMRIGDEMQEQPIPKNPKDAYQRIQSMIVLREELHHILDIQIQGCSDETLAIEQRKLNAQYDLFVKKYGNLNTQTNARLFKDDGDCALLLACENIDKGTKKASKSEIFYKRTIRPYVVPTSTDDPFEALQISKNERGRVDISYIEELTGKSYDDVLFELGDAIFRDPEISDRTDRYSGFVTSEDYLSGKVIDKLQTARFAAAEYPEFKRNVEALEKVQPIPLTASEITIRLGQTWVDKDYYKEFYCQLVGVNWWRRGDVELFYNPHDSSWRLDQKDNVRYDTKMKQQEVYGTKRAPAYRLLIDCMNLRATTIYDTVLDEEGKERRVLNQAETIEAREKQNKIKEEFANWIYADPDRRKELVEKYNRLFNRIKLPSYDGSYLEFPEMNPAIELRPHQKSAIHRIITSKDSTLLHHVVGSGKTYTMAASIMKMRQLGLCNKAMVAVPNHLVQQWANEWRKLYPNAKILVATKEDLEKDNRQKFVSKVAMGDWDGIIIAQSSFAKIPVSQSRQINKLNAEIECVEATIENQWLENGMPRGAVKNLERIKKTKQAQLKKLMDSSKKDDVLTFENLGVDYLYIDEAHYYKNLFLYTKMNNVAGISNAASARASDLKLKCEYLQELHGSDRGVVFATGTPISNSMAEMYTMQSYLQPSTLKELGIDFFDGWAADFGETITSMELAPSGKGYQARTRFAKFTNLPELLTLYRSFSDVQTADMVKLNVPEAERHVINLKPSDTVIKLAEKIAERAERIHTDKIDPSIDNMLKVTSDGKKLALDPRCFVPESADENDSKLNEATQRIFEIWQSTAQQKGTQIVFCDLSTPKVRFEEYKYGLRFDAYNDIKFKLVQKGIPADEIAFIHDAKNDEQKQALFDKVNSGMVRVLIGSTEKCGAGTNVQKRLIALHHLDTPYRPSDMEQREGRIIRQGNENKKVDIYTYVTERTFDSYSYQILENKQKFISQINKGDLTVREAEDIDETSLSYAEIKAITAANPRIKRKMEVDAEISRLRVLEGQYRKNLYDLQDKIRKDFPEEIRRQELLVERATLDLMHLNNSKPANPETFVINVNGKVYTDKKEGGKALTDALYASKPETVISEYCGFKISMNPMRSLTNERDVMLISNGQYTVGIGDSSSGNLTRLDNFIEDFPNRKERLENRLKQIKYDLEIAKEQVEKPFEHKEKLSALLQEQAELDAELNLDKRKESVIIDDGSADDDEDNYMSLPTQKNSMGDKIIDIEDKVATMKVAVLPDYTVTQEDMHRYGYCWDGMLPLSMERALFLWGIGLQIYLLESNDSEREIEYEDFKAENKMYGIEKPEWNDYLKNEKSFSYFMARLNFIEAARKVFRQELNHISGGYGETFLINNSEENDNLKLFLEDKPAPEIKEYKQYAQVLLHEFTERMWNDVLLHYGWTKNDMTKSIISQISNPELKEYCKIITSNPFNAQIEIDKILSKFTDEEITEMNLPPFDDELTVVAKEPSVQLRDNEFLPGLLMLRNEITGRYYVINDTSAKGIDGKELKVGDTTNVETVLAYNGLNDGNPLKEFSIRLKADAYFKEKSNIMRSIISSNGDNRTAVINSVLLEYDEFEKEMNNSPPKTVYHNHYKIHCYESLKNVLEEDTEYFSEDDYKSLYKDRGQILNKIYNEYILPDISENNKPVNLTSYDDTVKCIKNYCMANHSKIYNNKPVYLATLEYAQEHNELEKYHESRNITLRCKSDISKAFTNNYDGMRLKLGFEDRLIDEYGMKRIIYILANTIREHETDGRFSKENKEWASKIRVSQDLDERRYSNLNLHPAVLDIFVDAIRLKQEILYTIINDEPAGEKPTFNAYSLDKESGEIRYLEGYYSSDLALEATLDSYSDLDVDGYVYKKIEPEEFYKMSERIKAKNKEKEKDMSQEKYKNFTVRGDKVLSIIKDRDDRNIAIIQRVNLGDFVVAAGYDLTYGTWGAAKYDFSTLEAAEQYRTKKYGFENTSDTIEKKWLTCKISPEALIKKYQFNTRFMMPKGSGYEGYAYSIFNDRIKEGTITTDLKSDTRERALLLRIPDNQNVEISGNGKTVEIEPHEFISLVNETLADKYEPEQRYTVGLAPEAFIKEYVTTMLLIMPNDTKYKGYVYYLPKSVISDDKYSTDGALLANIGEHFKITIRKGEEKIELTAKEYLELVGDKKADKYLREPSELDEYREQQGENEKKWETVQISENAVIANYENSTLFKMPKGDYAGFIYYIPSGMVRKEDDGLFLRMPEDFTVHLKDSDDKVELTMQDFVSAIKGKADEDYESVYRAPSEEVKAQFAKVEQMLKRNVPEEMRNKPNWVVVRTRENNDTGRLDKFLINPHTGKFAESDNPETWADFETACKYAKENGGVCLAYALEWDSDIACIDLDGCMQENGDFSKTANDVFDAVQGSYTEKSISGKGLHIFGKTKGADLRSFSKDKTMEYYQGGHFIAMTGNYYGSSELKSFDTPEMQRVLTSKLEKRTEWKNTSKGVEGLSSMDDREMLDRAFAAKNGDTVKRLYNGEDVRGNISNSDMSLMNYLAFWSNHDIDQMLRVFSTSGLYRPEKSQSYYEHTAIKAIKGTPCYTPPQANNKKLSGNNNDSGNKSDKGGK